MIKASLGADWWFWLKFDSVSFMTHIWMIYSLIQIWYDQTYILSFYLNLKCTFSFFVAFRQTYVRLGICRHRQPHIANQTYVWLTSAHLSQSPFMSVTLWETSSRERHNTSRVSFKFILNIGVYGYEWYFLFLILLYRSILVFF